MVCNIMSSWYFDVLTPFVIINTVIIDLNSQSCLIKFSFKGIKYKCFFVIMSKNKAITMTLSNNKFICWKYMYEHNKNIYFVVSQNDQYDNILYPISILICNNTLFFFLLLLIYLIFFLNRVSLH